MRIRLGCELIYDVPAPTPMIVVLNVHHSRFADLERPDFLLTEPAVPIESYRDSYGNWCCRLVAPAGRFKLGTDGVIRDQPPQAPDTTAAIQHQVQDLPADTLQFLLGSRYCETDRLSDTAWRLFERVHPAGRACRPSATTCMSISRLATRTRTRGGPQPTPMRRARGFAVTSPIWRSRFAAA